MRQCTFKALRKRNGYKLKSRSAALALFTFLPSPNAFAQEEGFPPVTYPQLVATAADAAGFVPKGWKLDLERTGDLNADGVDDLMLVLLDDDPKNIVAIQSAPSNPVNTNPYILAVAFGGKEGGNYRLALQNHTLIPRPAETLFDELYTKSDTKIEKGSFTVALFWFGGTIYVPKFRFRFQHEKFDLIGFDSVSHDRSSSTIIETSVNYSTGKAEIKTGTIENDISKSTFRNLKSPRLLMLDEIGDGTQFEPELIE